MGALRSSCESFLLRDPSSPPVSTGCGSALHHSDVESIFALLRSGSIGAQTTALFAIGRVAYLNHQSQSSDVAELVVTSGLFSIVTRLLASGNEVRRQAITTVKILSTSSVVAEEICKDPEVIDILRKMMCDIDAGG